MKIAAKRSVGAASRFQPDRDMSVLLSPCPYPLAAIFTLHGSARPLSRHKFPTGNHASLGSNRFVPLARSALGLRRFDQADEKATGIGALDRGNFLGGPRGDH